MKAEDIAVAVFWVCVFSALLGLAIFAWHEERTKPCDKFRNGQVVVDTLNGRRGISGGGGLTFGGECVYSVYVPMSGAFFIHESLLRAE